MTTTDKPDGGVERLRDVPKVGVRFIVVTTLDFLYLQYSTCSENYTFMSFLLNVKVSKHLKQGKGCQQ